MDSLAFIADGDYVRAASQVERVVELSRFVFGGSTLHSCGVVAVQLPAEVLIAEWTHETICQRVSFYCHMSSFLSLGLYSLSITDKDSLQVFSSMQSLPHTRSLKYGSPI